MYLHIEYLKLYKIIIIRMKEKEQGWRKKKLNASKNCLAKGLFKVLKIVYLYS